MKKCFLLIVILLNCYIVGDVQAVVYDWKLPYEDGVSMILTRGYDTPPTHVGKDRYALDFTQAGCGGFGKAVVAVEAGEVVFVNTRDNWGGGYGLNVIVDHDGVQSRYAHLNEYDAIAIGDAVGHGVVLGFQGNTGNVAGQACPEYPGTHLHFTMVSEGVAFRAASISGYGEFVRGREYLSDNIEKLQPSVEEISQPIGQAEITRPAASQNSVSSRRGRVDRLKRWMRRNRFLERIEVFATAPPRLRSTVVEDEPALPEEISRPDGQAEITRPAAERIPTVVMSQPFVASRRFAPVAGGRSRIVDEPALPIEISGPIGPAEITQPAVEEIFEVVQPLLVVVTTTIDVEVATSTPTTTIEIVLPTSTPTTTIEVVVPTSTPTTTIEVVIPTSTPTTTQEIEIPTSTPSSTEPVLIEPPVFEDTSSTVVISEIAWMGTGASANDEWFELHNPSFGFVDLTGWRFVWGDFVSGTYAHEIDLTGLSLPPGGVLVFERTDQETVSDFAGVLYAGAFGNSGEQLALLDALDNVIDFVDASAGWFAGNNDTKATMVRVHSFESGDDAGNWCTFGACPVASLRGVQVGEDAEGNVIVGSVGNVEEIFISF